MMTSEPRRKVIWGVLVLALAAGEAWAQPAGSTAPPAQGQGRAGRGGPGRGRGPGADGPISPAEIQTLLDAWVVVQAERELALTDTQYPQFLARLRGLQNARRRAENQRNQSLMELRRLLQAGEVDEAQIRERLKVLDDAEAQTGTEIRQARTSLDQILNVRQQARFRLLEEQIERRKLELFARSRVPPAPQ